MGKKGQTTAFIIVAIIIVVLGILLYFFYPRVGTVLGLDAEPSTFMSNCIEPAVEEGVDLLAKQGGYANPEGYILYNDERVKYLCYTSEYYVPCYVQQPLIKANFEQELAKLVKTKADDCAVQLKDYYRARGYTITGGESAEVSVSIIPEKIIVTTALPMQITKEATSSFNAFNYEKQSKMYSLLMTATSIIDFESTYGDSETTTYMDYYPNLKIQKNKLGDGSTIYTIEDVTSEEQFTFASRSLAWPGGYGLTA